MADKTNILLLRGIVTLLLICLDYYPVLGGGVDLTCINRYPVLETNGDDDAFIGAYKDGDYIDAGISFGREVNTGPGGTTLPRRSFVFEGTSDSILFMPSTNGRLRLGAFYCRGTLLGEVTDIVTITMPANTLVTLLSGVTQTVSVGEAVTFRIETEEAGFVWKKGGNDSPSLWQNQHVVSIPSVQITDADIYECHGVGDRGRGQHTIMRLLVRACPANKWEPPTCNNDCPLCYNGGICDDQSGKCICAPGFSGVNCDTVHGSNRFGQGGQQSCSEGDLGDPHSDACRGRLFCLPDPYGCSCAAGYEGLDCETACTEGSFGANCRQECHCSLGSSDCLIDTGECISGTCEPGWSGVNCQVRQTLLVSGLSISSQSSTTLEVTWDVSPEATQYEVDYRLVNLGSCDVTDDSPRAGVVKTDTNSYTIKELTPYSTYEVYVTVIGASGIESDEGDIVATTDTESPSEAPQNIQVDDSASDSLTYTWDEIPCGRRGGEISGYQYTINGNAMTTTDQSVSVSGLSSCTAYTFEVGAMNDQGLGPIESVNVNTRNEKPGPVTSFNVFSESSTHLGLLWNPPATPNPPCTTDTILYDVQYQLISRDQCEEVDENRVSAYTGTRSNVLLNPLEPNSVYGIYIIASNSEGSSEEEMFTATTFIAEPSIAPVATLIASTSSTLLFNWSEIPCGQRGSAGNMYEYRLTTETGEVVGSNTTSELRAQFEELVPCTAYTFEVFAFNAAGNGPSSPSIEGTTDIGVLGPVQDLDFVSITSNRLTVSWQPHDENPCPTESYAIEYALINSDNCEEISEPVRVQYAVGGATQIPIAGLQPYSTYEVYVFSVNDMGYGPAATLRGQTAEVAPTAPPANVQLTGSTYTTLTFQWEEVPCGQRGGSTNLYAYILTSDSGTFESSFVTDELSVTIPLLQPCTVYTFVVTAVNTAGTGVRSETVRASTDSGALGTVQSLSITDSTSTSLSISWGIDRSNPCYTNDVVYVVEYALVNRDQCEEIGFPQRLDYGVVTDTNGVVTNTNVVVSGLFPHSTYEVYVRPRNELANGTVAFVTVTGVTAESAPTAPPANVQNISSTSTTLTFQWEEVPCGQRGGIINLYDFILTSDSGTHTVSGTVASSFLTVVTDTIPRLQLCTVYNFVVTAVNTAGTGVRSETVRASTDSGVPDAPASLTQQARSSEEMTIAWEPPVFVPCEIVGYTLTLRTTYKPYDIDFVAPLNPENQFSFSADVRQFTLEGLAPSTEYEIKILAYTVAGRGDYLTRRLYTNPANTRQYLGEPLRAPVILDSSATSATIEIPQLVGPKPEYLTEYQIIVEQIDNGVESRDINLNDDAIYVAGNKDVNQVLDQPMPFTIGDEFDIYGDNPPLEEGATYNFYIGSCSAVSDQVSGCIYSPPVTYVARDTTTPPTTGRITTPTLATTLGKTTPAGTTNTPTAPPMTTVPTTDRITTPTLATTSGETTPAGTTNTPTAPPMGTTRAPSSTTKPPIVVEPPVRRRDREIPVFLPVFGFAACVVLLVIILMVVKWGMERRRRGPGKIEKRRYTPRFITIDGKEDYIEDDEFDVPDAPSESSESIELISYPVPIYIVHLRDYVKRKKSGSGKTFRDDFQLLPYETLHYCDVAKKEVNRKKNRYSNISAYDHSRVVLTPLEDDPDSDYINANYIDGFNAEKKYIATQGPTKASVNDFWRMIWQQNVMKIVMVTNLVENGKKKCEKYWPDQVETYGTITVTMTGEYALADYTIRQWTIIDNSVGGAMRRQVYQFHYTVWQDNDVPDSAPSLLKFITIVKNFRADTNQPTVVHCSAGVGRTGTVIALESLLEQAEAEKKVHVFKVVSDMRQNRMKMVQTPAQYEFIFDAIIEDLYVGDTSIPAHEFKISYDSLVREDIGSNQSEIGKQFQDLQQVIEIPTAEQCIGGSMDINVDKNRYRYVLPADAQRPYLRTAGEEGSTDYINATFVHGYRTRNLFLSTQMPLTHTRGDFWRMVYEYDYSTIIMLNTLELKNCEPYWPDQGSTIKFGSLSIECMSEEQTDSKIVTRVLVLKADNVEEPRTIVQYALTSWPEDDDLPDPQSVLTLAKKAVYRIKKQAGGRVVVHCGDGMAVSGTFCSIVLALECLEAEQMVDVYQTVKRIRKCNPRAVKNKEQYKFIYDVMLENLMSGSSSNLDQDHAYDNVALTLEDEVENTTIVQMDAADDDPETNSEDPEADNEENVKSDQLEVKGETPESDVVTLETGEEQPDNNIELEKESVDVGDEFDGKTNNNTNEMFDKFFTAGTAGMSIHHLAVYH